MYLDQNKGLQIIAHSQNYMHLTISFSLELPCGLRLLHLQALLCCVGTKFFYFGHTHIKTWPHFICVLVLCLACVVCGNDFFFVAIFDRCRSYWRFVFRKVLALVVLRGLHHFVVPRIPCLSVCDLSADVDALSALINGMVGVAVIWLFTFHANHATSVVCHFKFFRELSDSASA